MFLHYTSDIHDTADAGGGGGVVFSVTTSHHASFLFLPDSCPSPVHANKPLWVTKWVDYSNKYGFGFQLSDKNVGVLFNDTTRMLLTSDGKYVSDITPHGGS